MVVPVWCVGEWSWGELELPEVGEHPLGGGSCSGCGGLVFFAKVFGSEDLASGAGDEEGGMKNLRRAERKKWAKRFRPGQLVTWGLGRVAHVVLEVNLRGVVVDAYGVRRLVLWDGNAPRSGGSVLRSEGTLRPAPSGMVPNVSLPDAAPFSPEALAYLARRG